MKLFLVVLLVFLSLEPEVARASPSGRPLRLCSQNLFRYGEYLEEPNPPSTKRKKAKKKKKNARQKINRNAPAEDVGVEDSHGSYRIATEEQRNFLVQRFRQARCDVVAVQEVMGATDRKSKRVLDTLAHAWSEVEGEPIDAYIGPTAESVLRNGFLVRRNAIRVLGTATLFKGRLPSLQPLGPTNRFLRGPIAVVFDYSGGRETRRFSMWNFHLKSRVRGFKDASGTDYELLRMEMAAGIHAFLAKEARSNPDTIYVAAGDRNSDRGSGSAEVLSGRRSLEDFRLGGGCRLNEEERAICEKPPRPRDLIGVFEQESEADPAYRPKTFKYRKKQEQIDEIYVTPRDVAALKNVDGRARIGLTGDFLQGSDHKLLWAEFRF